MKATAKAKPLVQRLKLIILNHYPGVVGWLRESFVPTGSGPYPVLLVAKTATQVPTAVKILLHYFTSTCGRSETVVALIRDGSNWPRAFTTSFNLREFVDRVLRNNVKLG